jgi:membrane protease YdiL (CAAX protease family)
MTLRDLAVLAIVVAAYFFGWIRNAWPFPLPALFPKLFLGGVALYCFLIGRKLDGSGYTLIPEPSDFRTGFREWIFYLPVALAIGEATHFIRFHPTLSPPLAVVNAVLLTALLVALPEEMFFRSILQNLLETRLGRTSALFAAAIIFGLSHFNHGAVFNWRYVLLASLAGIFYGRAWRAQRHIFAAIVTHTAVDVVWSFWFR